MELQATSKIWLWRPRLRVCILGDLGVVTEPLPEPQNLRGRWVLRQSKDLREARLWRDPFPRPLILPKGPQGKLTQALATSSWALTCCRQKPKEAVAESLFAEGYLRCVQTRTRQGPPPGPPDTPARPKLRQRQPSSWGEMCQGRNHPGPEERLCKCMQNNWQGADAPGMGAITSLTSI